MNRLSFLEKRKRNKAFRHYSKFEKWLADKPCFFQDMMAEEIKNRFKVIRILKHKSDEFRS